MTQWHKGGLRALTIAALVLLAVEPIFGFGRNKIAYDEFDWKVSRTTHFDIHFYEAEAATLEKVASLAESAYERLARKLNFQIEKRIPLIFYATHADFEQTNVELNFIPEGVGAFAEPARNRMVLPVDLPDDRLEQLIAHELVQIFEYEILFQGELRKAILLRPPLWFMEGLASYLGEDEDDRARMVLRDAVTSNLIPRISESGISGYFAYRFGHAAFDFVEAEWGPDGVRDLVFEFRSAIGNSVEKALKRAFDITPEEFDTRFRRWLQKKYLPVTVEHGDPVDYGERLRLEPQTGEELLSVVPSPSGDLAAAFSVVNNRIEILVFGLTDRQHVENLSRGRLYGTEYPIVQFLTTGPLTARDLSWSPDGDSLAYFARKEKGRVLVVLSALDGAVRRVYPIRSDQALAPTFSPDSRSVVYRGITGGQSDIWRIDLATGEETNLTHDAAYDTSPAISRDGVWLYYSAVDGDRMKIFRMSMADSERRERVTEGPGDDEDVTLSPDGKRLFFSSSREASIYNVYSLDLETGEIDKWTDVSGGAFAPSVIAHPDGTPRLVFTAYQRRGFSAYVGKLKEPVRVVVAGTPGAAVTQPGNATPKVYVPEVQVPADPAAASTYRRGKLFVDNADLEVGITDDQRFYSRALLSWSDVLGNRRFIAILDSLASYTDYRLIYFDLASRLQKGLTAYSQETYYVSLETTPDGYAYDRDRVARETAVLGLGSYPLDRSHRIDFDLGYVWRKLDYALVTVEVDGEPRLRYEERDDHYPRVDVGFVGDSTEYKEFGPYRGRRYQLGLSYAPDLAKGGTLIREGTLDWREYIPVTRRSLVALRLFAGVSDGNAGNIFFFGGLDTFRGQDFRTLYGSRIAFANLEFRFPVVDTLELPFLAFHNIQGHVFLDVGAAYLKGQDYQFWDSDARKLEDGQSAYGWGFSWDIGGIALHWEWARRWDFRRSTGEWERSFWIGQKF